MASFSDSWFGDMAQASSGPPATPSNAKVDALQGLQERETRGSGPATTLTPTERARRALSLVLQAMQEPGMAAEVAKAMDVSESTISRLKNDKLEEALLFLAHLGFKCVPQHFKCIDPDTYGFLIKSHQRFVSKAPSLLWEDE